ncbi:hypothetical protein HanRHA438_Chr17g0814581 [Helianthus annuus]|uniref:Uncharacterized protein n=1 Tax=Helianthus annuus TaxID=4232 RepID=A0A251RQW5_HELAN|nr:hypothetical protein HanXRQr2_Chr17g0806681 [Helianthus annuus]KAJ0826464.1 hypothetical protein HanRHA438_Chr17g0814581 [Helianthus annuus]
MPRFNSTTTAAIPFSLYHSLSDPIHLSHGGGKQNDRRSGDVVTMIMFIEMKMTMDAPIQLYHHCRHTLLSLTRSASHNHA